MIRVESLSFSYGSHQVLDNISFSAEKGDFLAILGPNGAGKSTLFRCMLGLIKNYRGTITSGGRDIRSLSRREMAGIMSYIPQNFGTAFAYSVLDTVLMGTTHELGTFSNPKVSQIRHAEEALARVGISDLSERMFNRLSGGEQQLVMIARALSQQAGVLMMDEPTASLDYGNREKVLALLRDLTHHGYTVILSTHDPQHALSYSGKVLALQNGRVAAFGKTEKVLSSELLQRLYGIHAVIVETNYGKIAAVPHQTAAENASENNILTQKG